VRLLMIITTIVGTPQMFLKAILFAAGKDNRHSNYHESYPSVNLYSVCEEKSISSYNVLKLWSSFIQ